MIGLIGNKKTCKGLYYRYRESVWVGDNGALNKKITLTPLKRLSCDGSCEEGSRTLCDSHWMPDGVKENMSYDGELPLLPSGLTGEGILKLNVDVSHPSYEYPNEVDVDFYFTIYKESIHD